MLASSVMLGYNDIPVMFQSDVAVGTFVLQLFQAEVRLTSSTWVRMLSRNGSAAREPCCCQKSTHTKTTSPVQMQSLTPVRGGHAW
jgi:hypothetical protein